MAAMRLDGYIRVSRVSGRSGDSFISPEVQRERIEGIAAAGGHEIVEWHEDLDQSGAKADRPGFQSALSRIESGETDGIVVAKLDRFSRSAPQAAIALERIREAGGAFISAGDSFDTSTPTGRFALDMMLRFAQLQWEERRESWRVAREKAVERGIHIASRTPTGYDRTEDRRLVPNRDAEKVREAFEAKARGASWRELSELMAGVASPYGSTEWPDRSLSHLLSNRVYLGEARSGEFVNLEAHEPIVTEELFRLAQAVPQKASPRNSDSLLTGILRCAGCRYSMKPDRMKPKFEEERVRLYRCRGRRASGKCSSPSSTLARKIEPYVIDLAMERMESIVVQRADETVEIDAARDELDEAIFLRDNFLSLDVRDPAAFQRELDTRQAAVDRAEAKLVSLRPTETLDGARLPKVFPDLDVPEQRQILGSMIDAIFLRRAPNRGNFPIEDRVFIAWRGEGPSDLPGPGRRNVPLVPFEW